MGKTILFAVDGSHNCNEALRAAGAFLKNDPDYRVLLYHCVPELQALYPGEMMSPDGMKDRFETAGRNVLETCRGVLSQTGIPVERIEVKLKMDSVVPALDILNEAADSKIQTVMCGRRGTTAKKGLLIGSTSSRLAQYGSLRTIWVVDPPAHQTGKILIAMEGSPDSRALTYYAAEFFAPIAGLSYTLLHFLPKLPPRFWDHGRILNDREESEKNREVGEWRSGTLREVEKFLSEARDALVGGGVPGEKVRTRILYSKTDIASDMLDEIERDQYQFVLIGKKSYKEQKPFLIGSNANKILKNAKNTILCLVDS